MNACRKYHMSTALCILFDTMMYFTPLLSLHTQEMWCWKMDFCPQCLTLEVHFFTHFSKTTSKIITTVVITTKPADLVKCKAWLNNLLSQYVALLENGKEFQVLLICYLFSFCRILIHLYCSRRQHQKSKLFICTSNSTSKYEYAEMFAISSRSELKFTFTKIQ